MVMATVVTAMVVMVVMGASGELEVILVDMDTYGNQKLIFIYLFNKISDD